MFYCISLTAKLEEAYKLEETNKATIGSGCDQEMLEYACIKQFKPETKRTVFLFVYRPNREGAGGIALKHAVRDVIMEVGFRCHATSAHMVEALALFGDVRSQSCDLGESLSSPPSDWSYQPRMLRRHGLVRPRTCKCHPRTPLGSEAVGGLDQEGGWLLGRRGGSSEGSLFRRSHISAYSRVGMAPPTPPKARHMGTIYLLDIHSKCKQPHKMLRLDPCKRVTAQQTDSGAQFNIRDFNGDATSNLQLYFGREIGGDVDHLPRKKRNNGMNV
ncbi:hypothetical protein MUK42_11298 [Musa troglodytarum]|uniref:Uncharacterized protein n=1 Tax=Musa troglodytarum TaxID=320322 RepID=A0A9E7KWT1_9LILI|nr:hypothetical protein MUK42_11298 [Musa troglodytarum]